MKRWGKGHVWTRTEDAILMESISITCSRDRKAWAYARSLGVNRTYHSFIGRRRYLEEINGGKIDSPKVSIPKGWGFYV